jgi:microcystin-dependent protein
MSQHDYNIANAPGATVRADINALAEAMASQNSGASAPSVTFAFMFWADTTNSLLKMRNPANSGWITIASIVGSSFTLDDAALAVAVSGDWFGTTARIPRIATGGGMEVGSNIDFHPDAAGSEDYRLRIARATGANGAATVTQTGSGGLNVVPGSGGFQVDGVLVNGHFVGEIIEYSGTTLPDKCVWANGQNLDRTTYAALFAATGTTYGAGDGSTTFGVIDKRGRVGAGRDDMGGSAANRLTTGGAGINGATLGAAGGAQTVTLTLSMIPAHAHSASMSANSRYGANHSGSPETDFSTGDSVFGSGTRGVSVSNAGGDGAHTNTQPTIIVNYVVYAGV